MLSDITNSQTQNKESKQATAYMPFYSPTNQTSYNISLVAQRVKRLPAMRETQVQSLGREVSWRRKQQPT